MFDKPEWWNAFNLLSTDPRELHKGPVTISAKLLKFRLRDGMDFGGTGRYLVSVIGM